MKIGNVVGSIWATRKAQCLQGQTFLVVCSGTEELVAAGRGRAWGPGASGYRHGGLPILYGCPGGRRGGGNFGQ